MLRIMKMSKGVGGGGGRGQLSGKRLLGSAGLHV